MLSTLMNTWKITDVLWKMTILTLENKRIIFIGLLNFKREYEGEWKRNKQAPFSFFWCHINSAHFLWPYVSLYLISYTKMEKYYFFDLTLGHTLIVLHIFYNVLYFNLSDVNNSKHMNTFVYIRTFGITNIVKMSFTIKHIYGFSVFQSHSCYGNYKMYPHFKIWNSPYLFTAITCKNTPRSKFNL